MAMNNKRMGFIALLAVMLAVFVVPMAAQAQDPAPTPADPAWRAFRVMRDALEEEFNTDLTYVRSWTYAQVEWVRGIDSCDSTVIEIDYRPVYFGWRFDIESLQGPKYVGRVSFDLRSVVICDQEDNFEGATSVGPDAAITPGGGLTGTFELGGHIANFSDIAVNAMKASGMTWVKKQLRYSPGAGTGQAQAYVDAAKANGFKLLLGIVGYPNDLAAGGDAYINDFANYLGSVAALGVDAIEVWNEPNIDREWPAGQISGGNYVKMLQAAYGQIKARNSNTLVISGAPAPTGFFGAAGCTDQGCNDDVFMQQMAAAGANNYMDCVGLHYNEGIVAPGASGGDSRGSYPTYFFGSMTARGWNAFNGKQICYTELGYLSGQGFNTPIPAGFAWAGNVTVANQAEWLAQAATIAANSRQVRMMIVWNIDFQIWNTDPQAGYAILRPDGTCPACATLGTVMGK
ncbi:MAG TPA: hypothetical protein PKX07_02465 [Aggregatilineales bacterium]|nr:hypothetical protein [Aggregatilineales bacterium]